MIALREGEADDASPVADSEVPSSRTSWAELLARIYEVLPLLCPSCGGDMRILAFLTDPPAVRSILEHLDLPHRPPPVMPARGPPRATSYSTSPRRSIPPEAEPEPAFDFDQSGPEFDFDPSLPDPVDG